MFEKKVWSYIRKRNGWPTSPIRVLAACSGGPDSVGLLYWLAWLKDTYPHVLSGVGVAVIDHSLRPESKEEVALVKAHARHLAVPCYSLCFDAAKEAEKNGVSVETISRRRRYEFLFATAAEKGYEYVATAHHRDDQAESILAHILRGSGIRGLKGMQLCEGKLLRPFLGITKKDIGAYVAAKRLRVAHDATNELPIYERNKLRLIVLPELRKINPAVTEALVRLGEAAAADDSFIEAEALRREPALAVEKDSCRIINRYLLRAEPAAIRRRLWCKWLTEIGGISPSAAQYSQLDEVANGGGCKQFSVGRVKVSAQYDIIQVEPVTIDGEKTDTSERSRRWALASVRRITGTFDELRAQWRRPGFFMIPEAVAPAGVELRHRQPGDILWLVDATGRKRGRKKLKDWCIDKKIPRRQRDSMLFLVAKGTNNVFAPADGRSFCIRSEGEAPYYVGAFKEVE